MDKEQRLQFVKEALKKPLIKNGRLNKDLSRDDKIVMNSYCAFILLHGEGQGIDKFMKYLELD